MTELILIAATDRNRLIGCKNRIPWHISADLKLFKKLTWGWSIVMGRATFESLGSKVLPGRCNIVISNQGRKPNLDKLYWVRGIDQAIELARRFGASGDRIFFIGGSNIYRQVLDKVDKMYLTHIDAEFEGDRWFPAFDPEQWDRSVVENHSDDSPYGWKCVCYSRKIRVASR